MRALSRVPAPRPRRSPRRRVGLVAVALGVAVTACGTPTVPLDELAIEAEEYDGQEVTTYGVVAEYGPDDGARERHFVIQDGGDHRVRLLPDEVVEAHVGAPVQVTGDFRYDQSRGRALEVDVIDPVGD